MFTDSRSIDDRATAASFDTALQKYAAATDSWFDGTPFSIDARLAQCKRLIHIARQRTARRGADAGPLTNLAALEADSRALVALREDLLTGAYDREDNSPIAGVHVAASDDDETSEEELARASRILRSVGAHSDFCNQHSDHDGDCTFEKGATLRRLAAADSYQTQEEKWDANYRGDYSDQRPVVGEFAHLDAHPRDIECPECGVGEGKPCVTYDEQGVGGRERIPARGYHDLRKDPEVIAEYLEEYRPIRQSFRHLAAEYTETHPLDGMTVEELVELLKASVAAQANDAHQRTADCGDDEEFADGEHDEGEQPNDYLFDEMGRYRPERFKGKESSLSPQDRRYVTLESSRFLADNTDTNDARELATRAMHHAELVTSTYDVARSRAITSAFVANVAKGAGERMRQLKELIHPLLEGISYGMEDMDDHPTGDARQEALRGLGDGFRQAVPPKRAASIDNLPPEALYL